ncbi:hypothetical protein K7432_018301 [Basidiobolus ranarum]|uniref:Uncharacterized protein n=1 Tax=Basidiobolus ranarum TaxID=34480 RepID=A0ABR2VJ72_9FUNG
MTLIASACALSAFNRPLTSDMLPEQVEFTLILPQYLMILFVVASLRNRKLESEILSSPTALDLPTCVWRCFKL